jgi:hypothetical protein
MSRIANAKRNMAMYGHALCERTLEIEESFVCRGGAAIAIKAFRVADKRPGAALENALSVSYNRRPGLS